MSEQISISGMRGDTVVIGIANEAYLTLGCSLEHLKFLIENAIIERDISLGKIDPDEGFSKPMGPWGKDLEG